MHRSSSSSSEVYTAQSIRSASTRAPMVASPAFSGTQRRLPPAMNVVGFSWRNSSAHASLTSSRSNGDDRVRRPAATAREGVPVDSPPVSEVDRTSRRGRNESPLFLVLNPCSDRQHVEGLGDHFTQTRAQPCRIVDARQTPREHAPDPHRIVLSLVEVTGDEHIDPALCTVG